VFFPLILYRPLRRTCFSSSRCRDKTYSLVFDTRVRNLFIIIIRFDYMQVERVKFHRAAFTRAIVSCDCRRRLVVNDTFFERRSVLNRTSNNYNVTSFILFRYYFSEYCTTIRIYAFFVRTSSNCKTAAASPCHTAAAYKIIYCRAVVVRCVRNTDDFRPVHALNVRHVCVVPFKIEHTDVVIMFDRGGRRGSETVRRSVRNPYNFVPTNNVEVSARSSVIRLPVYFLLRIDTAYCLKITQRTFFYYRSRIQPIV